MTKNSKHEQTYDERLDNLSEENCLLIKNKFKKLINYDFAAFLNTCVHCGLCADTCHYYIVDKNPKNIPANKLGLINKVFNRHFDVFAKITPALSGSKVLNKDMVKDWVDSLFGRCTLCGRCALNCTMGINIPYIIRAARGALAEVGLVPPGLQSTVDTAIEKGNNMGIARDDWLETIEWLEEELQDDVNDPDASLPLDKKGARLLYTINPREAMFFPLSISAAGKIFYAAGESWTFSSDNFDVTNYGLYSGDDRAAGLMSERLVESRREFGCEALILAECGHGFNSNRWEAPEWLDTLHDPCNLVRLGGIVEEQRYILNQAVTDFVEMTPNREKNYCCGGGGGQLAMTRYADRRLKTGKLKADQIKATGAKIVVTPCHNCIDQLMELNKHYKLEIEIKTVAEIVADALVI